MSHNKRKQMKQALVLLQKVVQLEKDCPAALPGSALRQVKNAIAVIKKDPMMQKERGKNSLER